MPPIFKEVIKEETREIKETKPKVEERKQEEPKVAVCPPKPAEQPMVQIEKNWVEANGDTLKKINLDGSDAKKPRRRSNQKSFPAHDYPIGHYNEKSSAAQADNHSPTSNAQARVSSEFTGAKVNNLVEGQSVGKKDIIM